MDPLSAFMAEAAANSHQEASPPLHTPIRENLRDFDIDVSRLSPSATLTKKASDIFSDSSVLQRVSSLEVKRAEEYFEENLLNGEKKLLNLRDAYLLMENRQLPGILYMTSYRIIFIPDDKEMEAMVSINACIHSWLDIPLCCIDKIEKERKMKDIRYNSFSLTLHCKDVRTYNISIMCKPSTVISSPTDPLTNCEADVERAIQLITHYTFPNSRLDHVFAFDHGHGKVSPYPRLEPYDPLVEFTRQGIMENDFSCAWRISTANMEYRFLFFSPQVDLNYILFSPFVTPNVFCIM